MGAEIEWHLLEVPLGYALAAHSILRALANRIQACFCRNEHPREGGAVPGRSGQLVLCARFSTQPEEALSCRNHPQQRNEEIPQKSSMVPIP